MKSITASDAKQYFGELLTEASQTPVRIVRHGKAVAAVVPAAWLEENAAKMDPRAKARAAQKEIERARDEKHRRIALALLLATASERRAMIKQAEGMVDIWQAEQLCSRDYIDAWRAWLRLPVVELARAMTNTEDSVARSMRQNSPFVLAP